MVRNANKKKKSQKLVLAKKKLVVIKVWENVLKTIGIANIMFF